MKIVCTYLLTASLLLSTTTLYCNDFDMTEEPHFITQTLQSLYSLLVHSYQRITQLIAKIPAKIRNLFLPAHPHQHDTALVRHTDDDDIPDQEKSCIALRKQRIKKSLSHFLDSDVATNDIPHIALCLSGGGFRATLMSLGFLQGAYECGLFDNVMYIAALSGSTFTVAPWLASGKTFDTYRADLAPILQRGLDTITAPSEVRSLFDVIMEKGMSSEPISIIDIFGSVLANTFLRNTTRSMNPIKITMSEAHAYDDHGGFPIPIYTAIDGAQTPYEWLEFTPFEAGKKCNYIPLWSYGRTFKGGISTNFIDEQTFGYFLGMFGSAYAVNLKDAIRSTIGNISHVQNRLPEIIRPPFEAIMSLLLNSSVAHSRFFPALAPEFAQNTSADKEYIQAVDAGIDFNLPTPPLLRAARAVDMIIIYDASEVITHGKELFCAQHYADRNELPFPHHINFTDLDKQLISIFKDETNPSAPVIVYMPRIKNEAFSSFDPDYCLEENTCGMLTFEYKDALFNNLCDLPRFTLKQNIELIKREITALVQRKKASREQSTIGAKYVQAVQS